MNQRNIRLLRVDYLTLIYDEKIAFILNVEKLPSKEKLIEESRNIK